VHERFDSLKYNFKSDIIRYYILHNYGGIWLDTDVIITRDLNILMDNFIKSGKEIMIDIENINNQPGCASLCMIGNSVCSKFCYDYVNDYLNSDNKLVWGEIGPITIQKLIIKCKDRCLINEYSKTKLGCNYICWNDNPGINKDKWYFYNSLDAENIANNLLNNEECYYVLTWTIYRQNNISENLTNSVFNDSKSIFYHICMPNKWDFIDKIIYINLTEREDRQKNIEEILCDVPINKVQRFNAIKDKKGYIGCTKSHIECLKLAKKNNWKNVMIIEDDAIWDKNANKAFDVLNSLITQPYDVILLGATNVECNSLTYKLYECQSTTGYIVSSNYYDTLLNNFKEGLYNLIITNKQCLYAVDVYWKKLQKTDNWFICYPFLLIQKPCFSTIENKEVDYVKSFNIIKFIEKNDDIKYSTEKINKYIPTFNILIATIGRPTLQIMLDSLFSQLNSHDCVTIVFDGKTSKTAPVYDYSKSLCKVTIYYEPVALGYHGHGIRNKYAKLLQERDFVMHADDDDTYYPNIFIYLRNECTLNNTLYIAFMIENNSILYPKGFKVRDIKIGNIGTPCGIIPYEVNKNGCWKHKYGGDGIFYEEIISKIGNDVKLLPRIIYKIR
jgi:glycosyl transferase family 25